MKTTIEIADPILRKAKLRAAQEGTTLRAVLERALEKHLDDAPTLLPVGWTIKPFHGEGLNDEFKNADWSKIRDTVYGLPNDE